MKYTGKSMSVDFKRQFALFKRRVQDQGQEKEAQDLWDEVYRKEMIDRQSRGESKAFATRHANMQTLAVCDAEFPENESLRKKYQGRKEKEAEQVRLAAKLGELKAEEEVARKERKARLDQCKMVQQKLKSKGDTSLIEDIEFARQHVHLIGDSENSETWLIDPADAPSASAWNLLMYARTDTREFFKIAIREIRTRDSQEAEAKLKLELASKKVEGPGQAGERSERMRFVIGDLLRDIRKKAEGDETPS